MGTPSNFALRLPRSLKAEIEKFASKDGTTVNQFIVSAAVEKLSALHTAEFFAQRAKRGDLKEFRRIMSRKRDVPTEPGDELPE